jgi:hypothetical protein
VGKEGLVFTHEHNKVEKISFKKTQKDDEKKGS